MTTFVILWAILGLATLSLAVYRMLLSLREDNNLHLVAGEERLIPGQLAMFRREQSVDYLGVTLTAVTILFGLGLVAAYLYQAWLRQY